MTGRLVMRVVVRSASPRQLALFSLAWAWLTDTPMPPSVVLCVRLRSCSQVIGCVVEAKYQSLRNKIKDFKLPVKGGTIQLTALADRTILFLSIVLVLCGYCYFSSLILALFSYCLCFGADSL